MKVQGRLLGGGGLGTGGWKVAGRRASRAEGIIKTWVQLDSITKMEGSTGWRGTQALDIG